MNQSFFQTAGFFIVHNAAGHTYAEWEIKVVGNPECAVQQYNNALYNNAQNTSTSDQSLL